MITNFNLLILFSTSRYLFLKKSRKVSTVDTKTYVDSINLDLDLSLLSRPNFNHQHYAEINLIINCNWQKNKTISFSGNISSDGYPNNYADSNSQALIPFQKFLIIFFVCGGRLSLPSLNFG